MFEAAYHAGALANAAPRSRMAASPAAGAQKPVIDPDFVIAQDGYHVRFAQGIESLRSKIRLLVDRMYSWRGLQTQHQAIEIERPGQTTLVACSGDHLFATLTVGFDSAHGLLADTLYRAHIDEARRQGARVCEVTRLAIDPTLSSPQVMATIFHLGFILARLIHDMTDSFIEVHPRHAGFYERMLGYRVVGDERTCPRVGAPAVLMHLSLEDAEEKIQRKAGQRGDEHDRSLYRLFFSPAEQALIAERMRRMPIAA